MILHESGEAFVCIGQASHALVSGRLARHWGNERFAAPEPFDDVCLATEQHDVGMAEWDLEPALNPDTGLPMAFVEMPRPLHLELWSRAPSKMLTQSPYAALLISMHGHALYARSSARPDHPGQARLVDAYLERHEAFQRELLAALREDPARARRNQRLIWTLDFLSLAPLTGWVPRTVPAPTRGDEVAGLAVEQTAPLELTIDPWPFDRDELTLSYEGRLLDRRFDDEDELHAALAAAPWVTVGATWRKAPERHD
jgi:hypothetical protein